MDVVGGEDLLTQILHQNDGQQRSDLNISDVIEAISIADPAADMARSPAHAPFVRIVEQPASKAIRFRYECEGRSAGSIPGVNSNGERRTYPTIEISGCTGKALVVVSCVTRDEPYRPHPHNLVGREHCRSGVCTVKADLREGAQVTFSNLGIQCVKRRDIVEALKTRERLRVDPFRTGFAHVNQPQSIDLNAVRLCFQVFLDDDAGKFRHPLPAVVSDVIFDKKAMSDLHILRTSQPSGPAAGGNDVILLCEKVNREDIAVVVYEEGQEPLEQNANLIIIHKQVAIAFTMPAHRDPQVEKHVDVFIQLKRPSDNARSNSVPYQYIPAYQAEYLEKKRRKTAMPVSIIEQIEQETAKWNQEQKIKTEPAGSSPRRYTPLESAGEYPYHQQWPQEMPGATMPGPYYGQEAPWQGQPFAAPAQTMQGPRLSPNMQATTTQGQMSPQRKVISPHGRVVSPHGQLMSPQGHVMSPQGHVMSPQGHVMSPQGHVMSPQGHVMSPQGHVMSPQGHVMSPQGHVMSPQHQAMSPNHPAMSPHHQALSPQGQMMSPQGQMMSPHGQMMSPQGQVISPQAGQVEVPGDRCGAAQMEHVSRNIDAMAQQAMAFAQAQQQAMDTNSESFSLTSLLAQGEPMQTLQNYSGDLSGYLGPAQHGADLSDSLTRLSTSDLLS